MVAEEDEEEVVVVMDEEGRKSKVIRVQRLQRQ